MCRILVFFPTNCKNGIIMFVSVFTDRYYTEKEALVVSGGLLSVFTASQTQEFTLISVELTFFGGSHSLSQSVLFLSEGPHFLHLYKGAGK